MFSPDEADQLANIVRRVVREELRRHAGAGREPAPEQEREGPESVGGDTLFDRYWAAIRAKHGAMDVVRERAKKLGTKPKYQQDRRYREAATAVKVAQAAWSASIPTRSPDPEARRLGDLYSAAAGRRRTALDEVKARAEARGVKPEPWKDSGYLAAVKESRETGRAWREYTAAAARERRAAEDANAARREQAPQEPSPRGDGRRRW